MNYLTTLWKHEVILAFEEQYKDIGCQVCKVVISNYFWEGAATKIPEKIKLVGFVSGDRLCHEHKKAQLRITFFFLQKSGSRKPEMF
jgi:hypothetical protein